MNLRMIIGATIRSFIRDRLLQLLIVFALLVFLSVPALSIFSMRQVQELSVTLSLSAISVISLILTVIIGSSSVWRDIERRYLASVLGLPLSRTNYLMGKFAGIVLFIVTACILLGSVASVAIWLSSLQYPSPIPIRWPNIWLAIIFDGCKYILVAAIALLFSSLSTSFYFPFVATLAVYICGTASQEVYEYVIGDYGKTLASITRVVINVVYYILPNFASFDFKVQAVYPLPVTIQEILFSGTYFLLYTTITVLTSVWAFNKRELT